MNRNITIDILRVIGLLGVILAHTDIPIIICKIRSFDVILLVFISGISGEVRVNGLKQIPDNVEFACAELLNTPKGYYLSITTYINKEDLPKKIYKKDTIGIDFGCQTNFTISNGDKINCLVEESERLKRLQKKTI